MHLCSDCKDDSFRFRNFCAVPFADPFHEVGVHAVNFVIFVVLIAILASAFRIESVLEDIRDALEEKKTEG